VVDNQVQSPESRLGAIGDLNYFLNKFTWDDDLLLLASDTISSLSVLDLVRYFKKYRGLINAVFDLKDKNLIRNRLGCLVTDNENIIRFDEKPDYPETTITSIPYYIYPKESLSLVKNYIRQGGKLDAPGSIISWLIGKIPCLAFPVTGYYYDVGTIETYNKINREGFSL
jgi:glucose-1-phosphate thymidylyltransferase